VLPLPSVLMADRMQAFVTGASGFIGANLVRTLLHDGYTVRALVRVASDHSNLSGLQLETVEGDLHNEDQLAGFMEGCDAVFHCAALYSLLRRDRAAIYRTNVEGTRAMLSAARRSKVRRFVYTSSVAAIGVPVNGVIATEAVQSPIELLVGAYKKSKLLAEREALEAARNGLDVVVVNPSTPVGAYDVKPTPTGEIIVRFLEGRMPFYVDTGLNLIDVTDVARGHVLAYERGRPGERYILGNRNLTFKELLEILANLTGRPAPRFAIPRSIPLVAAWVDEAILQRVSDRKPRLSIDSVRMSREKMFYDSGKAVRELGLPQNPIEDALKRAIDWFRKGVRD
jgi:dihydroflavonol-4-reductase